MQHQYVCMYLLMIINYVYGRVNDNIIQEYIYTYDILSPLTLRH